MRRDKAVQDFKQINELKNLSILDFTYVSLLFLNII